MEANFACRERRSTLLLGSTWEHWEQLSTWMPRTEGASMSLIPVAMDFLV
jgi:hypothetical protein